MFENIIVYLSKLSHQLIIKVMRNVVGETFMDSTKVYAEILLRRME
jgi:hypothetical protein